MQEPSADKDEEYLEKMNKYLKEGAPAEEGSPPQISLNVQNLNHVIAGLRGLGGLGAKGEALMRNLGALGMDQDALLNILQQAQGGALRSRPTPPTAAAPTSAPETSAPSTSAPAAAPAISPDQQASMRNVLSNVLGRLGQQAQQQDAAPSLADVVDPDAIVSSGLFDQPKVVEVLQYLSSRFPHYL